LPRHAIIENKESNNNSNCDATESYFSFFLQIMDQYTILGRIGEGAHGIVLKAKHIRSTLNHYPDSESTSHYYFSLILHA
jgi:hypothetical protein